MKLGIENIKQPTSSEDQDVSIEELNARMAESEVDLQETLQEVEQTQRQLVELEEVQGNVEGLKATVENYGVTDALLEVANGGPPSENSEDKGEICRLLNRDDLPQVSEDNQQELSQELTTALEASASDVVQKVKELVKKIWESLKSLVQKIADMVPTVQKKLEKESKRLSDLSADDLSDDVWSSEINMVQVSAAKAGSDAEELQSDGLEQLLDNVTEKLQTTHNTLAEIDEAKGLSDSDKIWILDVSSEGDKELKAAGIDSLEKMQGCVEKANAILKVSEGIEDTRDNIEKNIVQPSLEQEEMDEDQAKVVKEAMKILSNAVKGLAKTSTKLSKTTLQAASKVK